MRNLDILSMCLRNLFKRKLRTILTMLGVVIGTVAIVVTISLGLAVDMRFQQVIEGMGDVNTITVQDPNQRWGMWGGETPDVDLPELNSSAVRNFESIPGVESVLPVIEARDIAFRSGPYTLDWIQLNGVRPQALQILGYELQEGRLLQEGNTLEAVFGSQVPMLFRDIFAPWDNAMQERMQRIWMGEEVDPFVDIFNDRVQMSYDRNFIWGFQTQEDDIGFDDENTPRPIRPFTVEVVGLLAQTGAWNVDEAIFMDIEMVQRLVRSAQRAQQQNQMEWMEWEGGWGHINARANVEIDTGYDVVYVRAVNIDAVAEVAYQIEAMGFPNHYATRQLEGLQEMVASQQQMLGAIGAVSLFVAAIGIANTMVMSTYERTREIGVMKVIGAALADIKKLFLAEAAMIGFFGGLFGVLFSYLISYILNNHTTVAFMGGMLDDHHMMGGAEAAQAAMVSLITPWLSGLALFFAALIGLVSGYFPARRATKLSALNAIRTE